MGGHHPHPLTDVRDPPPPGEGGRPQSKNLTRPLSNKAVVAAGGASSPASTRARSPASFSRTTLRRASASAACCGMTATPSTSPITISPGATATPPQTIGRPTVPRPAMHRIRRHAHRADRQPDLAQVREVAHHAVGHEGGDGAVLHHADDQVADDAGAGESIRARDDDVAGLRQRDSGADREVVARAVVARDGDADRSMLGTQVGLDAVVRRAKPPIASQIFHSGMPQKAATISAGGRENFRFTVSSGASSIMGVGPARFGGRKDGRRGAGVNPGPGSGPTAKRDRQSAIGVRASPRIPLPACGERVSAQRSGVRGRVAILSVWKLPLTPTLSP